jgi:type II secretory pathway component PulF
MTQLAERIQVRSEEELERKLNRIEPALVLVGSGLVGMILLSVLLPLTRIMAAIG